MDSIKELFQDNLRDSHWLGEIVNNEDPSNQGRCRIRVFGKFDLIPDEDLPWALCGSNDSHGQFAVPAVGDIVSVRFDNGNLYTPVYFFQAKARQEVSDMVSANGAMGVVSLFYDPSRMQLYWNSSEGVKLIGSAGEGLFQAADLLHLVGMGGGSEEPAVLGDKNEEALNEIMNTLQTLASDLTGLTQSIGSLAVAGSFAAALPVLSAAPLAPPLQSVALSAGIASTNLASAIPAIAAKIPPTKSTKVKVN
jgi:hypothetical protein